MQGVVHARADSSSTKRIAPAPEKKRRLGADSWGGVDTRIRHIMQPIEELFATGFPGSAPYPWGQRDYIKLLVRHILLAEPLVEDFGRCFAG
ncbi:hypothetical protein [Thermostaphylospora chromogena]|uniref:hypothetical protein n=1 Tax=Thermostaphylospora chromogena TaxID=35622 RepID=UPI000B88977C|nr:hypothetical protein [Thermostaphylospora chromogena]